MAFAVLAGQIITADVINAFIPISVQKPSLESRTSTTSRTADANLILNLPGNTTWDFELLLFLSGGNNAGDFAGHLEWPSDGTCSYSGLSLVDTVAAGSSADVQAGPTARLDGVSPGLVMIYGVSATGSMTLIKGRITMGATTGNLTLFWAQNSSNATASNVLEGSTFTARRAI